MNFKLVILTAILTFVLGGCAENAEQTNSASANPQPTPIPEQQATTSPTPHSSQTPDASSPRKKRTSASGSEQAGESEEPGVSVPMSRPVSPRPAPASTPVKRVSTLPINPSKPGAPRRRKYP